MALARQGSKSCLCIKPTIADARTSLPSTLRRNCHPQPLSREENVWQGLDFKCWCLALWVTALRAGGKGWLLPSWLWSCAKAPTQRVLALMRCSQTTDKKSQRVSLVPPTGREERISLWDVNLPPGEWRESLPLFATLWKSGREKPPDAFKSHFNPLSLY